MMVDFNVMIYYVKQKLKSNYSWVLYSLVMLPFVLILDLFIPLWINIFVSNFAANIILNLIKSRIAEEDYKDYHEDMFNKGI